MEVTVHFTIADELKFYSDGYKDSKDLALKEIDSKLKEKGVEAFNIAFTVKEREKNGKN